MIAVREVFARDEAATRDIGAVLAARLQPGHVLFLHGELGAGKTTLARGLLQQLLPGQRVKSPTYTLVERYDAAQLSVLHLDLYRLADPAELEFLGVREDSGAAALLVEWPERGHGVLPAADLEITLRAVAEGRAIRLSAPRAAGAELLANWPAYLDQP